MTCASPDDPWYMYDHWAEHRDLGGGRFLGRPMVRRTVMGWVVEQLEWWRNRKGEQIGHRAVYRWFPASKEGKARELVARL